MRENRTCGSEGGEGKNPFPDPYQVYVGGANRGSCRVILTVQAGCGRWCP